MAPHSGSMMVVGAERLPKMRELVEPRRSRLVGIARLRRKAMQNPAVVMLGFGEL